MKEILNENSTGQLRRLRAAIEDILTSRGAPFFKSPESRVSELEKELAEKENAIDMHQRVGESWRSRALHAELAEKWLKSQVSENEGELANVGAEIAMCGDPKHTSWKTRELAKSVHRAARRKP